MCELRDRDKRDKAVIRHKPNVWSVTESGNCWHVDKTYCNSIAALAVIGVIGVPTRKSSSTRSVAPISPNQVSWLTCRTRRDRRVSAAWATWSRTRTLCCFSPYPIFQVTGSTDKPRTFYHGALRRLEQARWGRRGRASGLFGNITKLRSRVFSC